MNEYISIKEILSRLLRHPLMQDITLEQVAQYTVDFFGTFGIPKMFEKATAIVTINNYRGRLPCDLIKVIQVREVKSNKCLRETTNTFAEESKGDYESEDTFRLQNTAIITSFKEGEVEISYTSIPVDADGFPMIINNPSFLKALEAYIKKEVFTILFDTGRVSAAVVQNIQQEYAWRAGQCSSEFMIPSLSEMQSIANSWCTLVQRKSEFYSGFKHNGDREYIRVQ